MTFEKHNQALKYQFDIKDLTDLILLHTNLMIVMSG